MTKHYSLSATKKRLQQMDCSKAEIEIGTMIIPESTSTSKRLGRIRTAHSVSMFSSLLKEAMLIDNMLHHIEMESK